MARSSDSKPAYVTQLETAYGTPSQAGFGSAVFFGPQFAASDLENIAIDKYKHFVGKPWQERGDDTWLGAWQQVYARKPGDKHDVVPELRAVKDVEAHLSIRMILDNVDHAEAARQALATAYDDPTATQLVAYTLGDGDAMSGILVAGRRTNGEATFLVFLLD